MTWIQTLTDKINLEDPQPDQIHLEDIAHALSQTCRFNGHTPRFYSVAEHSVLMAEHEIKYGGSESYLSWVLLHDAAEAYTGDVLAPHRRLPDMQGFNERSARLREIIGECFCLPPAEPEDWEAIRHLDLRMLATERDFILGRQEPDIWLDLPEPLKVPIRLWSPPEAKAAFLDVAGRLRLS